LGGLLLKESLVDDAGDVEQGVAHTQEDALGRHCGRGKERAGVKRRGEKRRRAGCGGSGDGEEAVRGHDGLACSTASSNNTNTLHQHSLQFEAPPGLVLRARRMRLLCSLVDECGARSSLNRVESRVACSRRNHHRPQWEMLFASRVFTPTKVGTPNSAF
jgi:hypothetical protein